MQETFHASQDYYERGPWFDAVKALHTVPRFGPSRRLPHERSRLGQDVAPDGEPGDGDDLEIVADVAMLMGCYFCQIPEGKCQGQWYPMLYVQWMKYCNPIPDMRVPEGEGAALARGAGNLLHLGVECFQVDEHEVPYMLSIDHVMSMVYYQPGYLSMRAGEPDFYWVDTLWDCL